MREVGVSPPAEPAGSLDEAVLVAGLQEGDPSAFETVVRLHAGRLLAVGRRLLGNEDDAQDAVQEAMLSAFRAAQRFRGGSLISTWLHRITVNTCLMKLRTRRRKPEEPIDDLLPAFSPDGHHVREVAAWTPPADLLLEQQRTRELVQRAIQQLPESYRTVLLLRDIEELDTAETAQALGISPNAVKIRLHRARQALRALLDPHFRSGEA